ncbi:DUF6338 family protein [Pseudomonas cerasi]
MESISSELFNVLKFLLPGFLTAWIFHAFTAYPKPSQFERVIQALIFTIIIQGLIFTTKIIALKLGSFFSIGTWDELSNTLSSYVSAILLGLLFSYYANNDKFHNVLRKLKITKQSSYHCEWYGAFHDREKCRIVLNLVDGRRIYGWPYEWPSDPTKGHMVLTEAAWIDGHEYIELPQVNAIMFKVSDIQWVEFINDEDN